MKKNHIHFCLLVLGLSCVATGGRAEDVANLSPAEQAALLESEVIAAKEAKAVPKWRSSVGDIEKTAAALMETHAKLTAEHSRLAEQISSLQAAIESQQDLNRKHVESLKERKGDIANPQKVARIKLGIAEAERAVAQKRVELATLQARMRSLDNRLNLRKLRISELQLQQKSWEFDRQSKDQLSGDAVQSEIEALTRQINTQVEQEKLIRTKIAGLQNDQQPFVAQARSLSSEMAIAKDRLASASDQAQNLSVQLASTKAKRAALENDKDVLRYKTLVGEKETMNSRIAQMQDQILDFEKQAASAGKVRENMKAELVALDKENQSVANEVDDLRENIAILEYKIHSLDRYQGRNRNSGR